MNSCRQETGVSFLPTQQLNKPTSSSQLSTSVINLSFNLLPLIIAKHRYTNMNSLMIILPFVLAVATCSAFTPSTNNVQRATHLNAVKFDKETQKWFTDDPDEMEGSSYVSFVIWLWYYAYQCS